MLYLQKAALTDGREIYEMLQRIPPENGVRNSCYQMDWADFPAWLAKRVNRSKGIGLEDWMVPNTTFWLIDDGVAVGFGSLRHRLNDTLRERGGHIGCAVDGTKRGRGYGKALLGLMIQEARRMGITEELLVTIHPDNTASRKVAEANGGELRRETADHVYYWFA
ncbi:MAG: GNAT family N-acetyltransferase [Oscillospiraceae bacterium]